MIQLELRTGFIKAYKKRITPNISVRKQTEERIRLFQLNPKNPLLHDHALVGKKRGFRSFSVSGNLRIIYSMEGQIAYFIDIGTHNQVY